MRKREKDSLSEGTASSDVELALLERGVSASKARQLGACHSLDEVLAGCDWIQVNAKNVESHPGMLVRILEDGTAASHLNRRKEEEERLLKEAVTTLDGMLRRARESDLCDESNSIVEAWPDRETIFRSGVVTVGEFLEMKHFPVSEREARIREWFKKLAAKARRHIQESVLNESQEGVESKDEAFPAQSPKQPGAPAGPPQATSNRFPSPDGSEEGDS